MGSSSADTTGWSGTEPMPDPIRAAQNRVIAPLSDREREMLIDLLARVIKVRDIKAGDRSD
jgi:hypothetical protein